MERTKHNPNPRNDPRYEEKADKDGYFHCPYFAEGCTHKPTKQKCIYAYVYSNHVLTILGPNHDVVKTLTRI